MFFAIFIGSMMMINSLAISIVLFGIAARMLRWMEQTRLLGYKRLPLVFDLGIASLWILLVLTGSVWGWAALYMVLGLFENLEPALYFSIVSFTTVGYGDVVLDPEWRLLAGMTATHGLLTFGLFTAFLVEVFNFPTRARRS
ncbi:ion channel [Sulfitobacter sp.]|uniref:ion channel n=1 Tax=Sulfitobacter sp. TaxID=1903071 RepID=UPI003EF5F5C4